MRRKQARALLPTASFHENLINRVPQDQAGKRPDPDPVGQPDTRRVLATHGKEIRISQERRSVEIRTGKPS
jgi:hypothetical protein